MPISTNKETQRRNREKNTQRSIVVYLGADKVHYRIADFWVGAYILNLTWGLLWPWVEIRRNIILRLIQVFEDKKTKVEALDKKREQLRKLVE